MPNGLTLDLVAQKLYWADARLDKLERADLDGNNRYVLTKVNRSVHAVHGANLSLFLFFFYGGVLQVSLQHPFDVAVYGDFVFWTDWVQQAVLRANKFTGEDVVSLRKEVPRPMGIVAIHDDSYDCQANPCRRLNGGCEDLCRLDHYANVTAEFIF